MNRLGNYVNSVIDNRGKNPEYYSEGKEHPILDNFLINGNFLVLFPSKGLITSSVIIVGVAFVVLKFPLYEVATSILLSNIPENRVCKVTG